MKPGTTTFEGWDLSLATNHLQPSRDGRRNLYRESDCRGLGKRPEGDSEGVGIYR